MPRRLLGYMIVEVNDDDTVNDTSHIYPTREELPIEEFSAVSPDFYVTEVWGVEYWQVTKNISRTAL